MGCLDLEPKHSALETRGDYQRQQDNRQPEAQLLFVFFVIKPRALGLVAT